MFEITESVFINIGDRLIFDISFDLRKGREALI